MTDDLEVTIECGEQSVKTTTGGIRRLADELKKGRIRIMPRQTEMAGVAERTELGQRAFDVLEQKQRISDEQEKLAELQQALMDQMRSEGKEQFKASGHVFTIAELGEKLKITKG